MKKLQLDSLSVDSFATIATVAKLRGTVAGQQTGQCTFRDCPDSWNGTCYMSCWDSCTCDTDVC
ncbi:hypothetical protein SAMN05216486_10810 [bacterium JGI 053]|jgi:hypothetical protein|nr:hypothetical protein SAMN05216486_10810 [bacterium JGI 053]